MTEKGNLIAAEKQGRGKKELHVQERWTGLARRVVEKNLHTPNVCVLPASQGLIQLDELILSRLCGTRVGHM